MVKARQMKDAVQSENLNFLGGSMSQTDRILRGNVGGDRDLAGKSVLPGRLERRKRQHVGRLVLTAKLAVQRSDRGAAGHQQVDAAPHTRRPARAQYEARQRGLAQPSDLLLHNYQFLPALPIPLTPKKQQEG